MLIKSTDPLGLLEPGGVKAARRVLRGPGAAVRRGYPTTVTALDSVLGEAARIVVRTRTAGGASWSSLTTNDVRSRDLHPDFHPRVEANRLAIKEPS